MGAMGDKSSYAPASPPRMPLSPVAQIPLFNKMKRKRDGTSPVSPSHGLPPPKKRAETMSHVEIPMSASPRVESLPPKVSLRGAGSTASARGEEIRGQNGDRAPTATSSTDHATLIDPTSTEPMICDPVPTPRPSTARVDLASLREAIESQFSLEILFKHRELRLIDQEIAKCQVALEQLRRCHVIPYPATSSSVDNMQQVSSGSGPVFGNTAPQAPAWGITNGPYSRHLERWLLQDSQFDDTFIEPPPTHLGGKYLPERSTRGLKADKTPMASLSRSQRGSSGRLKALPQGYPEVKEEKGPMIVKRSSDGHMVKLVCLDCRRSNFNSAQGFINHCRIAHARQFLSHDAAIEASGEEMDVETDGAVESSAARGTSSAGLVHPLIRSAHLIRPTPAEPATPTTASKPDTLSSLSSLSSGVVGSTPRNDADPKKARVVSTLSGHSGTSETDRTHRTLFNPSPQTPHLSSMIARMGKNVNLDALVNDAKTKVEIDDDTDTDLEDGDDDEGAATEPSDPQSRSTRGVLRGGDLPAAVETHESVVRPAPGRNQNNAETPTQDAFPPSLSRRPPYPSPFSIDLHKESQQSLLDINTPLNLSPNTTDPHPAPSLVSDDGDHETTHSDSEGPNFTDEDEHPHRYIHAEVMEHEDMDLGEGSGLNLDPAGNKQHQPQHNPPPGSILGRRSRPSNSTYHRRGVDQGATEERHVSFANPTNSRRKGAGRNGTH